MDVAAHDSFRAIEPQTPATAHRRGFLLGSFGVAALGGCATAPAVSEALRAKLNQTIGSRKNVGMIAVVVDDSGERTVAAGSSGVEGLALSGDSVFEIMSITKVLTALLLADMVGRGEVAFDDPLADYLPVSLKARGRPITLLDLATYRSGLPNMPANLARDWYAKPDPLGDYTEANLYEFLSDHMPEYEPGTRYRYANLGFGLLGNALARRSGKSYEALLIERVCAPLGLDHTRITLTADMQRHLVQGHDLAGRPTPLWNFPALPGAGTVRAKVKDLTVFLKACMGLKKTTLSAPLARLLETRGQTPVAGTQAALGWYITADESDEVVWKSGLSGGCNTFIGFSTRTRRGAIVLSNFLWRPLDSGTINLGIGLIDAGVQTRDFGTLNT